MMTDTDGDGIEDTAKPFSDELAAPFGVVAFDEHVDVMNKTGLLRLIDSDDDGHAETVKTIASGWGHTDDYHDWAVGLPFDGSNYYASITCQQDDRTEAAAFLRGKVIQLTPRTSTDDDPRLFGITEISGGHRFAVGIARSQSGELFVSDNQGNYNPYNELNHVRPGLRYGFINKLEKTSAADWPLTPPSVNIPHPWTRSVNGICFLETESGEDSFGPFHGHLIGCEYDTRRLVRMSLQRVGDTFQGAVYPFSDPTEPNELLGPIACAVSPRGELYVGEMRDSGWGAGNNIGGIVSMRFTPETLPCGIAEIIAVPGGFEIKFTQPIDSELTADPNNYEISSATRISTPAYGGDDRERRRETIRSIELQSNDTVRLELSELRPGFVYDFHLKSLGKDGDFFPAEAFYTLNSAVSE